MNIYESKARKYKKGKSYQWSIPLYKGHPFDDEQDLIIILPEDLHELQSKVDKLQNQYDTCMDECQTKIEEREREWQDQVEGATSELNQIKDQYRELQQEHNKVVNNRDHDKERLIKALKEVSQREQVIRELQGRNVFDRIFNRIPEHIELPGSKTIDD
jgi:chromosome segregation ATPase